MLIDYLLCAKPCIKWQGYSAVLILIIVEHLFVRTHKNSLSSSFPSFPSWNIVFGSHIHSCSSFRSGISKLWLASETQPSTVFYITFWNVAELIPLCVVCGCFDTTVAASNSCNKGQMPQK